MLLGKIANRARRIREADPFKPRVFLSHVTEEFSEHCKALETELANQYEFFNHSKAAAQPLTPEEFCRRHLRRSNVVLLIIGASRGGTYSEAMTVQRWVAATARRLWGAMWRSRANAPPPEPRSYVEWEFDLAKRNQQEVLALVRVPLSALSQSQQRFLGRVEDFRTGRVHAQFVSCETFVQAARETLANWLGRYVRVLREVDRHVAGTAASLVRVLFVCSACMALVVVVLALASVITRASFLKAFGFCFVAMLVCLGIGRLSLPNDYD